ncbi:MAG: NAD(P)H-dependent oxidoreductase [Actinomycetaceae bacterium]|nr:NAD(P)H-dependent oxidoreductase [Actinomycetaceae bacterium]
MALKVVAVSAGLSVPSSTRLLTDRLIEATKTAAETAGVELEFSVIELRELALDLSHSLLTGMPVERVEAALDQLEAAAGLIAVTPIFAGSYAGLFKTFFDLVGTERLAGTPVVLAATGGSARHSLAIEYALRPLFTAVRAASVPTGVYAATDDFGGSGQAGLEAAGSGLHTRIERAGAELVFAVQANQADQALAQRHRWVSFSEAAAAQSTADALGQAKHALGQPSNAVGQPGQGAAATLLKSDGTKGRLRPDLEDFVSMTEIFKPGS